MFKTTLILLLSGAAIAQAIDVHEIAFTRAEGDAASFSPSGPTHLRARQVLLTWPAPDGTTVKGELLILFDASTNHYLWKAERRRPADPSRLGILGGINSNAHVALFSGTDSISIWWATNPLFVDKSTRTASSLDDAFDKALVELRELLGAKDLPVSHLFDSRYIFFVDPRQWDFWDDPEDYSAAPRNTLTRIESITRVDHGYRLRLRARWTGELTIGDDLTVKEPLHRVEEGK